MSQTHAATQCDYCGAVDNHPKSHWNTGESYHFDCLPYDKREAFVASHPLAGKLVEAAQSGVHGEQLRTFSAQLHADNQEA